MERKDRKPAARQVDARGVSVKKQSRQPMADLPREDFADVNAADVLPLDLFSDAPDPAALPLFEEPLVSKPRRVVDIPPGRIRAENAEALVRVMTMPPEGGYIEAITGCSFIFGDVLRFLCLRMGGECRVTLSTLCWSPENVGMFGACFDEGSIAALDLLVSIYFYGNERAGTFAATVQALAPQIRAGACRIAVAAVHTKVACVENARFRLLLRGSANLRSSSNVEEVMIQRNEESFAFHRDWMRDVIARYEVTRSPVRERELWQTIMG